MHILFDVKANAHAQMVKLFPRIQVCEYTHNIDNNNQYLIIYTIFIYVYYLSIYYLSIYLSIYLTI